MMQHRRPRSAVALLVGAGLLAAWAGRAAATAPDAATTTTSNAPATTTSVAAATTPGAGFTPEGLAALSAFFAGVVEDGRLPGVVSLVAHDGEIAHLEAQGSDGKGGQLQPDALFRMYSMTKAITSVAVMTLVEDGLLRLSDPVALHLPAFAEVQVQQGDALVAADRPPTIRDLLSHTSGTIGLAESLSPGSPLVLDATSPMSSIVDQIAALPLRAQPGSTWDYGWGQDIAGVVVERVTGQTLAEVFEERVFGPLGMDDTSFYVAPEDAGRLVPELFPTPDGDGFTWAPSPVASPWSSDKAGQPQEQFGGGGWGGGVVSTIEDYWRFAQMLLDGGEAGGARVLSRKSVEMLSSSHTGDLLTLAGPGYGFGLGVAVRTHPTANPTLGSVGRFGWAGAAFTYFFVDPVEDVVAIRLANVFGTEAVPGLATLDQTFDNLVYAARR